ncbi:MAG: hypothetical protein J6V14_01520 [Clostridia bacterium]|nr:hypothetical protein [Clostridia bacterium]
MATNIKAKKKKGSYDNKLIKWIAIGLAALVAIIVAVTVIVSLSTSYVAKAGSQKIYTYDFEYFLRKAISEEYNDAFEKPEGYDDLSTEEQNELIDQFFDDERKEKIKNTALEEARKFKAEYALAVKNGYKLSSTEKTNVKANIDYYYSYYRSMGLSEEMAKYYLTGGTMSLSDYKKLTIEQVTVEKYKEALKEGYTVTDADIRKVYDEEPDEYRVLSGRVFKFDIPTAPVDESGKAITAENTDEGEKEAYAKYLNTLENYVKVAEDMKAAIDAGNKFTLYDYDYETLTPKKIKDDDGKETEVDKVIVSDGTFEELCTTGSKWTSASSNKGVISVNHDKSSGVDAIDEFVLRVQWNSDRSGFVVTAAKTDDDTSSADSSSTDGTETTGEATTGEEATVKPTDLEIIKVNNDDGTLKELYLVRVEDINDIDSDPGEGEEMNSIQSSIKSTILEDKAVAELEEKIAATGNKYALKGVKNKAIAKIMKEMF